MQSPDSLNFQIRSFQTLTEAISDMNIITGALTLSIFMLLLVLFMTMRLWKNREKIKYSPATNAPLG